MKKEDFKSNLIITFISFAILIIIAITYTASYFFSSIFTKEFQEKAVIYARNIVSSYKYKANDIKQIALALGKSSIFYNNFSINPKVVEVVFKSMIMANKNLKELAHYDKSKNLIIRCDRYGREYNGPKLSFKDFTIFKNFFLKNNLTKKGIELSYLVPIIGNNKGGFIKVDADIYLPFNNSDFHIFLIDKKGNIFLSNFVKKKTIYDVLNYEIIRKILNQEGFISSDIYVKNLENSKLVLLQNKNLIRKTEEFSNELALVMFVISIFIAIPIGIFFSRPLYNFYEELDKRVKEEVEKRREKEQLLMHQSKLAALGEMLGNIAHQWRHPITRLSLLIQNLELAFDMGKLDKDKFRKFKENALVQINYMSSTIDDFMNFFKKDNKKVEFYLEDVVRDVLKLLEGRIKQNKIDVVLEVKNKRKINGLKNEFSQVILNILNNAIDALMERKVENKKIFIYINENITIEDNAGGIDEKIINKIFEPYFTTKFQSQGTGIGLYMSKVIIKQHFNGDIIVKNTLNGASFTILLP